MMKKSKTFVSGIILLTIAGFTFFLTGTGFAACPDSISSYWKLDETTGPTYTDFIAGKNGTGNIAPTPATGKVGGAQEFNGSTTGIDVPASRAFNWLKDESFSIEFWIKTDGTAPTENKVAIGRKDGDLQWWVGITGTDGFARFKLDDTAGNGPLPVDVATGSVNISDGEWHHVVAVRDESTDSNLVYVDGNSPDSASHNYTAGFNSATEDLNIGYINFPSTSGYYFDGLIDEVALYDRALSADDIVDHYDAGVDGNGVQSLKPVPAADAGDDQTGQVETTEITLDGTGSSPGYAGTTITYLWEQTLGTTVTLTNATTDTATFTAPDVAAAGETLTFRLTVTASDGQSNTDLVDIAIIDSIAPVADAGVDQSAISNALVTLDGTGSAAGSFPIDTYLWEQAAGTIVTLTGADTATATFTAPVAGAGQTLTFRLTVTASDGKSNTDTIDVAISSRVAPTANAGADQSVNPNDAVTLDGTGSTAGSSPIATYLWEQTAGTTVTLTSADTTTATFTAPNTVAAGETLTFRLTVTATDSQSSTDTVDVVITTGVAPVADAGADQKANPNDAVTLDGTGSTAGSSPIATYLWEQTAGTTVTLTGADTATAAFTAPDAVAAGEILTFQLTVTDSNGLNSTDTTTVDTTPTSTGDGGGGGCFINSMF